MIEMSEVVEGPSRWLVFDERNSFRASYQEPNDVLKKARTVVRPGPERTVLHFVLSEARVFTVLPRNTCINGIVHWPKIRSIGSEVNGARKDTGREVWRMVGSFYDTSLQIHGSGFMWFAIGSQASVESRTTWTGVRRIFYEDLLILPGGVPYAIGNTESDWIVLERLAMTGERIDSHFVGIDGIPPCFGFVANPCEDLTRLMG